jgi:hypothetical protein
MKQIEHAARRAFELINGISCKGEDVEKVAEVKSILQAIGAFAVEQAQSDMEKEPNG